MNVGLVTGAVTPSARLAPRTNVVLPEPSSPETVTTSPGTRRTARSAAIRSVSPAEWADLEPYFEEAVIFVEWPEAGVGVLPRARVAVTLEHAGADSRRLSLASDEEALLQGLH